VLKAGDLVGQKYRIVRLIGDGGMGSVYEARHELLGTAVALKFLHAELSDRPGLSARFLQEAKLAATIVSPHVARVTDMDTATGGQPFLVMELIAGESLEHLLGRERKLPLARAVAFTRQIARGLEAAHALGAVHRDLKPANVLVTATPAGPLLKLIDFGIAKLREGAGDRGLTRAGVVLGTPEYMPPEQLFAANDVDARADVYALGVMLFEMLSGQRPAEGEGPEVIVGKVLSGEVLSLATLEPGLPAELVAIVHRAIAGDRAARFASVTEFDQRLAPFESGASATAKTLPPEYDRPSFAKGSTEDAPPLHDPSPFSKGATQAAPPPGAPWPAASARAPAPSVSPRQKSRLGLIVALLVAIVGLGIALVVVLSAGLEQRSPPPLPTPTPPTTPVPIAAEQDPLTPTPPAGVPPQPGLPANQGPRSPATPTPSPDGGAFPIPIAIPSSFPPLPSGMVLPSAFPTSFPTVLPTAIPSVFPGFPTAPPASSGSLTKPGTGGVGP